MKRKSHKQGFSAQTKRPSKKMLRIIILELKIILLFEEIFFLVGLIFEIFATNLFFSSFILTTIDLQMLKICYH